MLGTGDIVRELASLRGIANVEVEIKLFLEGY